MAKFAAATMTVEDAAMIKYATTEIQVKMVNECLQLFGGYGYTDEYPIRVSIAMTLFKLSMPAPQK
ncbi:MAG: acyl-CoA dehydrogenase [Paracoccaceae bacterium]|jgi:acyl-CoA dehydrogenase